MQTQIKTDTAHSKQSQEINNYILDPLGKNYNRPMCIEQLNCRNVYDKTEVDTESTLLGLGQIINRMPMEKTDVLEQPVKPQPVVNHDDIYWNNFNQDTRVPKSCDTLSGATIDRFDFPPSNLQTPHASFQMKSKDSRLLHKYS